MEETRRKEKIRLSVYNLAEEREHFHQDIELLYVMEGSLDVVIGSQTTHMKAEDILLINANKKHSLKGTEDILYAQLMIEYHMVSDVFKSMNVIFWCDSTKDESDRYNELRNAVKELLNHYLSAGGNIASFAHISLCYHILDLLSAYFLVQTADKEFVNESDKFDERIQKINNYIRANYNRQISLKELSDKLYLSNGYLSRFFKKNYSMNFAEYLTNIRLFHAVDELLNTNIPITRIAFDNGFASAAVFNKAFKKMYGETPSAMRKKSKGQKNEPKRLENSKEIEERLERYLIVNQISQKEEQPIEKMKDSHSVKTKELVRNYWGNTLNVGMAADLLKSEVQEHLILLKESLGFKYVRFCSPFTKEMLIELNETDNKYNFSRLDGVLDFLLRLGVKPHIELGSKPRIILYNVQNLRVAGTRDVEFPDEENWGQLLEAMFRHLTHRYGREELDTWRVELWFNENKWDREDSRDIYFQLFHILYSTVKKYSEKLEVGGCGIRVDYQEGSRKDFYCEWMKQTSRPDFLSLIMYPYERGEEKKDHYAKRCTDNECLQHRLQSEKNLLEQAGITKIPIYITEWNLTLSDRNYMNDSCFKGAYLIKNILDAYGAVDDMAYWIGSDRASEYYDSDQLLYGGAGIMTKDGILKPAGFAFEFMKRLYSYYVGKGTNYLITTDGHDSYGIVCHNQRKLGYNYFFTKEDELEREHLWKYYEDRDDMELNLELTDVANGSYQVKSYRLNEQNGSVLNIWEEMDFEPELSRNDIKYFRRMCEPKLNIQKLEVKGEVLKLNISMQANEILFVRVSLLV